MVELANCLPKSRAYPSIIQNFYEEAVTPPGLHFPVALLKGCRQEDAVVSGPACGFNEDIVPPLVSFPFH